MVRIITPETDLTKALITSYLPDAPEAGIPDLIYSPSSSRPNHYPIRVLTIGIQEGVDALINDMYIKRFAEVTEWSRPMRARRPEEIMRLMTRYFVMNS